MKTQNATFKYFCTYIFSIYFSISFVYGYKVGGLTCESLKNPLGIETENPLLGWTIESGDKKDAQSAFQIIVSDNPEEIKKGNGNMWDSGKIKSGKTNGIEYQGKRLQAKTRYFWSVRSYNEQDIASEWSEPAFFEMGMIHPSNWIAQWIGDGKRLPDNIFDFQRNDPTPLLRKDWIIKKAIASARLYIAGTGYYETYLNGQKAGEYFPDSECFSPKTITYNTFDVTDMLQQGKNTWSVISGNRIYPSSPMKLFKLSNEYKTTNRPAILGQLEILYTDGHKERILTDLTWKTIPSPITQHDTYSGEHYDARAEISGWDLPGSETFGWRNVVFADVPAKILKSQMCPTPTVKEYPHIKPIKITKPHPQTCIFDMGQNITGVIRLKIEGERGTKISIRYGNEILPDGHVDPMIIITKPDTNLLTKQGQQIIRQEDSYILKGDKAEEIWQPKFTLHKFRYVEITGFSGNLSLENIEGILFNIN